ncbi:MAG: molecular chaperone TorD family protein [Acidimicrobiia bacterium]|nr:molecular chaperone TorD family protein [Acidimicrobiia bacterium]
MFAVALSGDALLGGQGSEEIREPGAAARSTLYGCLARLFLGGPDGPPDALDDDRLTARIQEASGDLPYPFEISGPPAAPHPRQSRDAELARLVAPGASEVPIIEARAHLDDQVVREVEQYYAHFGLSVEDPRDLPLDHLATELAFMSEVTRREATAVGNRSLQVLRRAGWAFLGRHLTVWVPRMVEQIAERQPDVFFEWTTDLLGRFVAADADHVKGLVAG